MLPRFIKEEGVLTRERLMDRLLHTVEGRPPYQLAMIMPLVSAGYPFILADFDYKTHEITKVHCHDGLSV